LRNLLIYCRVGYKLFNPKSAIVHGGAELDLYNIAIRLADSYRVYFLCEKDDPFEKEEHIQSVRVVRIARLHKRLPLKLFSLAALFWETLRLLHKVRPAIIFQETAAFETGLLCGLKGSARFVYRVAHDMDIDRKFISYKPWVGKIYEFGLRNADQVIAQTRYQQDMLKAHYGRDSVIVRNAQEIPDHGGLLPISRRSKILWIGRLTDMKRPRHFLDLAKANPNRSFVLAGNYEDRTPYVRSLLEEIARIPNLEAHWFLNWRDVLSLYRDAAAFVVTSDPAGEGFPNVVVEAMKFGCPLYSLSWDRDELIASQQLGRIFNGDVPLFISELESFLADHQGLERFSSNAYKYASTYNNIANAMREYRRIFQDLL